MKIKTLLLLIAVTLMSCNVKEPDVSKIGTWKLLTGIEKIESLGVNRINIEKYVRAAE